MVPQKIQSYIIDPLSLITILGHSVAVVNSASSWWQSKPAAKPAHCPNPNCVTCHPEKAINQVPLNPAALQVPDPHASQVTINHTIQNTTHHTVITAQTGNTVVLAQDVTPSQPAASAPSQQMQTQQSQQPTTNVSETFATSSSTVYGRQTTASTAARNSYGQLTDLYNNHYGKIAMSTVLAGYLYTIYSMSSLQKYLTNPKRVGLWFSEYDLNSLLLLEPDKMQELIVQEFLTIYDVSDEKSLKKAVTQFMNDTETEIACLHRYRTIASGLDTVSSCVSTCCSPCIHFARATIPFAGLALDYIPSVSLDNLFLVNKKLKEGIQERISRIHYYKNIFLQSTIVL